MIEIEVRPGGNPSTVETAEGSPHVQGQLKHQGELREAQGYLVGHFVSKQEKEQTN